jgi:glutaredoxin 3
MIQRAEGRTSVPQVFIDGEHVGGSTELHDLDQVGRLVSLLKGMNPGLRYAN